MEVLPGERGYFASRLHLRRRFRPLPAFSSGGKAERLPAALVAGH